VRPWLVSLAGTAAGTASWAARADEPAFQRLAGLASADVTANLQALRDDFALAPSEAERFGAAIAAALSWSEGPRIRDAACNRRFNFRSIARRTFLGRRSGDLYPFDQDPP
jgi:hypothetical protein